MNKQLGQNLLVNPKIVDAIVEKAGVKPSDVVCEIGPGSGNLTMKLLAKARKVVVIEADGRMVAALQRRVRGTEFERRLEIIVGDALKVTWPYFDVCVTNLPYKISSPFTFKLLQHRPLFRCAVVMFQREFAMRLVAAPREKMYSRLSINVKLLANVQHLIKVGKNNFRPPPKVESSVVRIVPLQRPPKINFLEWDGLIRLCFTKKNKTLGAIFKQSKVLVMIEENLRRLAELEGNPVDASLDIKNLVFGVLEAGEFDQRRSSRMDVHEFMSLLEAFAAAGIRFSAVHDTMHWDMEKEEAQHLGMDDDDDDDDDE